MREIEKISIKGVSKIYKNGKAGVKDLNLEFILTSHTSAPLRNSTTVDFPGIVGVLGRNGAGKTTLLRMLAGILKPTQGEILINNEPLDHRKRWYKENIGYLPQEFGLYPELTGLDFLDLMGVLYGIRSRKIRKKRINKLIKLLNLNAIVHQRLLTLSHGMKQKIGIAQALLNEPEILILDEPTSGLDPIERRDFFKLIKGLKETSLVLFSTHIISDIEEVCTRIIILDEGKLLYFGDIEKLLKKTLTLKKAYIELLENDRDCTV